MPNILFKKHGSGMLSKLHVQYIKCKQHMNKTKTKRETKNHEEEFAFIKTYIFKC